jgi:hypothetical protein
MKFQLDPEDLRPLVEIVVTETIKQLEAERAKLDGQLAFTEAKAAALIGVAPHVLGDARRRGEVSGSKCGKRVVYTREELLVFLRRNRIK